MDGSGILVAYTERKETNELNRPKLVHRSSMNLGVVIAKKNEEWQMVGRNKLKTRFRLEFTR